jgi:hypothetical protein
MNLVAVIATKTVTIDGLALECDIAADPSIWAIRWHGEALYGHITPPSGVTGGGDFRDPSLVAPYVAAWCTALQKRLAAVDAAQVNEKDAFQKWSADQTALTKKQQSAAAQDASPAKKK